MTARPKSRAGAARLGSFLALGGCVEVGPDFKRPDSHVGGEWRAQPEPSAAPGAAAPGTAAPGTATPGAAATGRGVPPPADLSAWWLKLNDPLLTHLIGLALHNSPTLQLAGQKILQADAQLAFLVGELFPQQQYLSGSVQKVEQSTHSPSYLPGSPRDFKQSQVGLTLAWELDFWGLYRRNIESGRATVAENEAGYQQAAVLLAAQVASAYVSSRTYEAQLQVARDNISLQREAARIAQTRWDYGEASELDARQAISQLAQTESQLPTLEASLEQARDALAVLLALTPVEVDALLAAGGPIPEVDPRIAVGIPRDVLRQRPDVQQAEFAAAAQSAQIGVAKAALFPSFSLGGTFGYATSNVGRSSLGDLFQWDSHTLQVGPSFTFPIFNYGRLEAQVRVQDALFRQAVLNYQNVVLQAQQDVEDARASLTGSVESVAALTQSAAAARRATELSLVQYKEGETNYTTVLTAQQTELSVENALVSARGSVPQAAISLYRALGGGWQEAPTP
jgi:NodT family efflux transporter outer membrane factor (OMF) lipoprotein